ncbi:MAG TPA: triose-phosphate isomerase [Gemmatimonadaceae bacterium]|nr:triose-phosphate isomerase [Gemmatimonadaceae bacterium]
MQRPVLAANWKMNHGPTQARAFVAAFTARWTPHTDRTVIFFPPALSVTSVVHALGSRTDLGVGVQNIWTDDKGAFTGENSAPMAKDAGARYVLVGHSERRHVFGETDEQTALKCAAATRAGLTPILCVGELLAEREAGKTLSVVRRQVSVGLTALDDDTVAAMAIAYEPVWAIGTGRTATPEDASQVHAEIRRLLAARLGERAANIPILYGGSVNTSNAAALLASPGVDGLLVGGASLDVDSWLSICNT